MEINLEYEHLAALRQAIKDINLGSDLLEVLLSFHIGSMAMHNVKRFKHFEFPEIRFIQTAHRLQSIAFSEKFIGKCFEADYLNACTRCKVCDKEIEDFDIKHLLACHKDKIIEASSSLALVRQYKIGENK
jgi:hypothetical protein